MTECHNLVISEFEKGPLRPLIETKELLVREVLGGTNWGDILSAAFRHRVRTLISKT